MVQNSIHRPPVLCSCSEGKREDTRRSCHMEQPHQDVVSGGGRRAFFPCSGNGNGSSWNNRGSNGNYWASSLNSSTNGRNLNFNSGGVNPQNTNNRFNGFTGRAVQHSILGHSLLLCNHGTHTTTTSFGFISSLLRCATRKVISVIHRKMGKESEGEYGAVMRRSLQSHVLPLAVEVLHHRLSEEAGDICRYISGQDCASPLLQLYAQSIRANFHSGRIQLYQRTWNTLWHWSYQRLCQKSIRKLAASLLCHALRYSWLFHAHKQSKAVEYLHEDHRQDGHASHIETFNEDMGRRDGFGVYKMVDRNHCNARSTSELYHRWRPRELGWSRPCQIDASFGRRSWSADWESNVATILECLSKRVRSVYEAHVKVSLLREICGRCLCGFSRPRMDDVNRSKYTAISELTPWYRPTHGKVRDVGSSQRYRVFGCLHQAVANLPIEPLFASYRAKSITARHQQAVARHPQHQLLPRNIPTHKVLQDTLSFVCPC